MTDLQVKEVNTENVRRRGIIMHGSDNVGSVGCGETGKNGSIVKFIPMLKPEQNVKNGKSEMTMMTMMTISCMEDYKHKSVEEIRLEDYNEGRNKLACSKCRKVTKPDFCRKFLDFFFISNFSKNEVFGHFLENASLVPAEIA